MARQVSNAKGASCLRVCEETQSHRKRHVDDSRGNRVPRLRTGFPKDDWIHFWSLAAFLAETAEWSSVAPCSVEPRPGAALRPAASATIHSVEDSGGYPHTHTPTRTNTYQHVPTQGVAKIQCVSTVSSTRSKSTHQRWLGKGHRQESRSAA